MDVLHSLAPWNPDHLPAWISTTGCRKAAIPSVNVEELTSPIPLLVSMSSLFNRTAVPAFFDNDGEVERPRIVMGPEGVEVDSGWPSEDPGIVVDFLEPTADAAKEERR